MICDCTICEIENRPGIWNRIANFQARALAISASFLVIIPVSICTFHKIFSMKIIDSKNIFFKNQYQPTANK